MTTEQTHNWKITISCYGKLQNDRSSQVDMENATNAIQKVLLAGKSTLAPHEIFDLVNCLRAILQLWTKGDQSPSNPWSQICIDASSVLVRVLTRPGNSADLMSRSSKLIMFVFARAPLMGEVSYLTVYPFCVRIYSHHFTYNVMTCLYNTGYCFRKVAPRRVCPHRLTVRRRA